MVPAVVERWSAALGLKDKGGTIDEYLMGIKTLEECTKRHDLSGVDYISSVGLRVLMIAARRMREAQATLALADLQSVVAEIFAISRFDKVIDVQPSVRAALQACSADALAAFELAARDAAR